MSLFDYVRIDKYPLSKFKKISGLDKVFEKVPAETLLTTDYQTKDLGCTYNGHFYLKKRRKGWGLYHHSIKYSYVEPDPNSKDDSFLAKLGHMEEESSEEIFDGRTQTVNVYESIELEDERIWIAFDLVFVKGELQDIALQELTISPITEEEKARTREWQEELRKSVEYGKTPIGKIHNKVSRALYRSPVFRIIKGFGSLVARLGYAIQNWRPL